MFSLREVTEDYIIEPILMPNYPVHLSFPILLGGGGISYVTENMDYDNNMIEDSEAFLIAEPGAEIELESHQKLPACHRSFLQVYNTI